MLRRQHRRGQVLLWTVIMLPVLLALIGLVFDGGLLWQQYQRARLASSAAAVAAASEIDPGVLARTGQVVLRPSALEVASAYARRNDPVLHITQVYLVNNTYIGVRGWTQAETVFLSIFGVEGFRLNVSAVERPAWGAASEQE